MNNFIERGGWKTQISTLLSESVDAKNKGQYRMRLREIQHTLREVEPGHRCAGPTTSWPPQWQIIERVALSSLILAIEITENSFRIRGPVKCVPSSGHQTPLVRAASVLTVNGSRLTDI